MTGQQIGTRWHGLLAVMMAAVVVLGTLPVPIAFSSATGRFPVEVHGGGGSHGGGHGPSALIFVEVYPR